MRCLPVAAVKEGTRGRFRKDRPEPMSRIGYVYDLFMRNKGVPIAGTLEEICGTKKYHRIVDDLLDYYGLDIRCVRRGTWVLAGEWFGRVYVDYIAARLTGEGA